MTPERQAWLALCLTPDLGPVQARRLVAHFGSPGRALEATARQLRELPFLKNPARDALLARSWRASLTAELGALRRSGARVITPDDDDYPQSLLALKDAPVALFVLGSLDSLRRPRLSIVGTRRATPYGSRVAGRIACELAARGITIISGFALGIDAAAHRGALRGGGRTVAVLGCGVDVPYPRHHPPLRQEIRRQGALLSEFPHGTSGSRHTFPRRNRLIAALADGVLVVEAGPRSGALITARAARRLGRSVYAVPGNVDGLYGKGVNRLLKEGALLVEGSEDILQHLQSECTLMQIAEGRGDAETRGRGEAKHKDWSPAFIGLDKTEVDILDQLAAGPRQIDEISSSLGMSPQEIARRLLALELKGVVLRQEGMRYVKK